MTEPACPLCAVPTSLDRWDDIAGHHCQACDGHFVRAVPLQEFLSSHDRTRDFERLLQKARDGRASARSLTCPDCRTPSYHVVRAGVVELDVCATCGGLYLDRGEATSYFRQVRLTSQPGCKIVDAVDTAHTGFSLADLLLSLFKFWH